MRERRLRSREAKDSEELLFDYNLNAVDVDRQLAVHSAPRSLLYQAREKLEEYSPLTIAESKKSSQVSSNGGRRKQQQQKKTDPLDPSLFQGHHRRMEREERRMLSQDRLQLAIDQARVTAQKKLLLGPEWQLDILHIVRIYDPNDLNELMAKRRLALDEIDEFLRKYDVYRRKLRPQDSDKASAERNAKKRRIQREARAKAQVRESPESEPPVYCEIRPCAFGYMLPSRSFPPREFFLPPLWITEVETFRLLQKFKWIGNGDTLPTATSDDEHNMDKRESRTE